MGVIVEPMRQALPEVRLDVPPGFAGIPITGGVDGVRAAIGGIADSVRDDPAAPADLDLLLGSFARELVAKNIRLYGRFAVDTDAEPALAELALALPELRGDPTVAAANRDILVKQLVSTYRRRHPDADVHESVLPAGPALVAQRAGHHRVPPSVAGTVNEVAIPRFTAEFQVPAPDAATMAVLTVTTTSEAGWPAVAAAARRVAESIRFEVTGQP